MELGWCRGSGDCCSALLSPYEPPGSGLKIIDILSISSIYSKIDKEFLRQEYSKGISIVYLAKITGFSRSAVKRAIKGQAEARRGPILKGQIPFGWRLVRGRLVEHGGEQKVIDEMKAMRSVGDGFRKIAAALSDRGVKTKNGGKWQASMVMKILKRSE